jgi:hypothetical protein
MTQPPTVPPSAPTPILSPQAFRIFLLGGVFFVITLGIDAALVLTGHETSTVAALLTKLLTAVVGGVVAFLTAQAPGPKQAALEKRVAVAELSLKKD